MGGSVHLESWVKQQYKEIGFGKGGGGPFIGKAALKQKLISRYPMHKERIRQLVNAIKHQDTPRGTVQASHPLATSSQAEKISQSLATPPPLKLKTTPQYPTKPQLKQAPPTIGSKINGSNGENSDSGFASSPEDAENVRDIHSLLVFRLKKFLDEGRNLDSTLQGKTEDAFSMLNLQLGLLNFPSGREESGEEPSIDGLKNAVLFSADVLGSPGQDDLPQYGLLGSSDPASSTSISDSRLFLNTNIPFSAFVCGVQGSGKSHTTACMVENCLIPSPVLGVLQKPLSALVFNFAEYSSGSSFRPCVKKVNVLVSPSNYLPLKALYTEIPGVTVQPFMLRPKDLNISTMLTLMSVNQTQAAPLYMGIVTKILRNMASETAESFNYPEFRRRLDDAGLDKKQEEFLNQRLDLLESFLDLDGSTTSPTFAAGEITIIDLSCPFMDASTACVLFKISIGLYLESDSTIGKVIVLDEAHKYMTDTPASKALTESLMGVIRQQRHYGARVIISTQEPSISPKLIDLCSITVMHRFSSPEWLNVLQRHILVSDEEGDRSNKVSLLKEILRLKTGQALVFAPSAIFGASDEAGGRRIGANELLKMRMRKRVTWDGGRSIVCV
ncbi:hypothetical protein G7Y89_g4730 [Cudoniella acicularis]|uniref:Zona occludens toxin N-terminal domain-containing protein n=1 Tax=Cudoniella acicularis TaxID=354080 RepID=A0A8H4W756_9HELO|nr:hypothetical protein G7Y89_g4730 [Cudoniella acicularis]